MNQENFNLPLIQYVGNGTHYKCSLTTPLSPHFCDFVSLISQYKHAHCRFPRVGNLRSVVYGLIYSWVSCCVVPQSQILRCL